MEGSISGNSQVLIMKNVSETSLEDQIVMWVLSVDRRLVLIEAMKNRPILKASDIAVETNRSIQNVSRALNELKNKGLIKCLNPEKSTWKRYVMTDLGRDVLRRIEGNYI